MWDGVFAWSSATAESLWFIVPCAIGAAVIASGTLLRVILSQGPRSTYTGLLLFAPVSVAWFWALFLPLGLLAIAWYALLLRWGFTTHIPEKVAAWVSKHSKEARESLETRGRIWTWREYFTHR